VAFTCRDVSAHRDGSERHDASTHPIAVTAPDFAVRKYAAVDERITRQFFVGTIAERTTSTPPSMKP
jgi:hypothetical protein